MATSTYTWRARFCPCSIRALQHRNQVRFPTNTQKFYTHFNKLKCTSSAIPTLTRGRRIIRPMHPRCLNSSREKQKSIHNIRGKQIGSIHSSRQKLNWVVPETEETAISSTRCNAGAAELGGSGLGSLQGIADQGLDEETVRKMKKKKRMVAGVEQDELVDPIMLADPESLFVEFNGVHVHHKLADCSSEVSAVGSTDLKNSDAKEIGLPGILLHGFGASAFSWERVMRPLARLIGAKVVAFDRPAFGLTSRVEITDSVGNGKMPTLNPYSLGFSIATTLSFIDLLQSQKAILIGHSAGCLVAANAYFEAPERVAALILVAPAIIAPLVIGKNTNSNKNRNNNNTLEDNSTSEDGHYPFKNIRMIFSRLWAGVSLLVKKMVQEMKTMAGTFYRTILCALFRSKFAVMLVRFIMDKYGREAVRHAWYDNKQVTDHIIHGYTKPLKCRGWERALLEYTLAMFTDSASEGKPPLQKRLKDISCPVLIVTGDTDRLVPVWNAERLAMTIPGSKFEVIKNCGHLPHEEKPEEFLAAVQRFLQWAFGTYEKQVLQTAA